LRQTSALVVVEDLVGGLDDVLGTIAELTQRG
jgi:phosphoglycolate phosphatase